jgi:hypothetical protein
LDPFRRDGHGFDRGSVAPPAHAQDREDSAELFDLTGTLRGDVCLLAGVVLEVEPPASR